MPPPSLALKVVPAPLAIGALVSAPPVRKDRNPTIDYACSRDDNVLYPEDRWYAWLNDTWVLIPPDKIVPDYAPDGQAYLFVWAVDPRVASNHRVVSRPKSSSASRFTAGAFGFLNLSQSPQRPEV